MTRKSENPRGDETGADAALALKDQADARAAFTSGVAIMSKGDERMVPPGCVIVVCRDPGMRRAGIEHQALKVWKEGEITAEQVKIIAADTETFAVIGVG